LIHTKDLIEKVKKESEALTEHETFYHPKREYFLCQDTYKAAKISAAGVVTGLKQLLEHKYDRGYCIVRPPGHHANKLNL